MNEFLAKDVLPRVNHDLKKTKAQLKYQEKELANHRRLDWSFQKNTPEQDKIEGTDPEDKQEFTFEKKSQDTVTEKSCSQASQITAKSKSRKGKKTTQCKDCKNYFRDGPDLRRHRQFVKDTCKLLGKPEKWNKND